MARWLGQAFAFKQKTMRFNLCIRALNSRITRSKSGRERSIRRSRYKNGQESRRNREDRFFRSVWGFLLIGRHTYVSMRNGEARAKKKSNFHDCQCKREESWADTGHWYVHRIDNPDLLESASPRELYDGYKMYLHAIVFEDYRGRTISYIPRWSQLSCLVVVVMKFQSALYNTRTNFLYVHGYFRESL